MRNDKAERRKKKLAERKRHESEQARRIAARAQFPDIVFDERFAETEFAAVVRKAARRLDFRALPVIEQTAYRLMRAQGALAALEYIRREMAESRANNPGDPFGDIGDVSWTLTAGQQIFDAIPSPDRARFFPFND